MIVSGGAFASGWLLQPPFQTDSAATGLLSISSPASVASTTHLARTVETNAKAAAESAITSAVISRTYEDINTLGKSLHESTDPLAKRKAFGRLPTGLTKENAVEIRGQIDPLEASDAMFREFHFAWGKIGRMEAVLHGTDAQKSDRGPALADWASADPAAATAWYDSLPEKGKGANRGQMKEAFVHGLAIADPAKAVDFVMGLSDAKDPRARQMRGIIAEKQIQAGGADSAASGAATLPDGEMRNHANYEIARAKVRTDPAAAAAWLRNLDLSDSPYDPLTKVRGLTGENPRGYLAHELVNGLAATDSAAALALASSLAADGHGVPGLIESMGHQVLKNRGLDAAARWAAGLSDAAGTVPYQRPDGQTEMETARGAALRTVAREMAQTNPSGAAHWALANTNPNENPWVFRDIAIPRAAKSPSQAIDWLESLGDSRGRNEGMSAAYASWASKDDVAVSQSLVNMPSSTSKDYAINGFVTPLVRRDSEAARFGSDKFRTPDCVPRPPNAC